jgi:hypothetical protein
MRYSANSTIYNAIPQISITDLKQRNCLIPGVKRYTTIHWEKYGTEICSASIIVDMTGSYPNVAFKYNILGEKRDYTVYLTKMLSNFDKGEILFFICPHTGKRCRKLYLIDGYFLHREAVKGLYNCQAQSKYYRNLDKKFKYHNDRDNLKNQLLKKYFKKTYAGKFTKKYLRLMEQLKKLP